MAPLGSVLVLWTVSGGLQSLLRWCIFSGRWWGTRDTGIPGRCLQTSLEDRHLQEGLRHDWPSTSGPYYWTHFLITSMRMLWSHLNFYLPKCNFLYLFSPFAGNINYKENQESVQKSNFQGITLIEFGFGLLHLSAFWLLIADNGNLMLDQQYRVLLSVF